MGTAHQLIAPGWLPAGRMAAKLHRTPSVRHSLAVLTVAMIAVAIAKIGSTTGQPGDRNSLGIT
jgi:hypothetical protein